MPDPIVASFLAQADWADAAAQPLAGDASSRRYLRLKRADGANAVLMIAPPAPDDSTRRFEAVGTCLHAWGYSPPSFLAADAENGLLLMEDLGDAVLARVIDRDPELEEPLYSAVVDFLADLRRHPAPTDLPRPDANDMAAMTAPAAHWYRAGGRGDDDTAGALHSALAPALTGLRGWQKPVLAHRDFHAENLLWLPERSGPARIGLLDFQDAFAGLAAYDLVSLLEDARRDLAPGLRDAMLARYAAVTDTDPAELNRAMAVLGAQRNLRILGVFARLCLHLGKARYVDLIPRVWGHLHGDLGHPDLSELRQVVADLLPPPHPDFLNRLRSRCGTVPTP